MYIVAPAGDIGKFYAAIKGGAHEIYMGLQGLGARRSAKNFTMTEYKEAINYAHKRGSRVFLTLNTVMMDNEIESLFQRLKELYENGLDAVIVQDFGMFKFIKENFPELEIHGSTQMTVTNHIEAEFLRKQGFKRVVLSRELSFQEIKEIRKKTKIELEVFVSGALCVAYSGKCYMSSFIGARSGNRGMCAQPCRKKYKTENDTTGYFLSPKDQLMGKEEIDKLKEIGIESIKIEGRMKNESYVYELVDYYKNLINNKERKDRIKGIFNRDYGKGYFYNDKEIINSEYSFNIGEKIGILLKKEILLEKDILLGDGLIFLSKDYEKLGGCNLSKIQIKKTVVNREDSKGTPLEKMAKKGDIVRIGTIPQGTKYIYRNYSKKLEDTLLREQKNLDKKLEIKALFTGKVGEKPILEINYINLNKEELKVIKYGEKTGEKSINGSLTKDRIYEKISELGDTTFNLKIDNFDIKIDNELFVPISELKRLKRECINELNKKIENSYKRIAKIHMEKINKEQERGKIPEVVGIVKTKEQRECLEKLGLKKIYMAREMVVKEKELLGKKSQISTVNSNLIFENSQENYLSYNITHLQEENNKNHFLHWTFNVTNTYTLEFLESLNKIEGVILSPELSFEKIKELGKSSIKKGLLIYSKAKVMNIETNILKNTSYIINEMNDSYRVEKSSSGKTDVYLEKPLDVTDRMKEINTLGVDFIFLEFHNETNQEIEKVYRGITTEKRDRGHLGYNYWKGVY